MSLYWQLSKLAGSRDLAQVIRYCSPYLAGMSSRERHYLYGSQGNTGQNSQSPAGAAGQAKQENPGPGGGAAGPAQGSQNGGPAQNP